MAPIGHPGARRPMLEVGCDGCGAISAVSSEVELMVTYTDPDVNGPALRAVLEGRAL